MAVGMLLAGEQVTKELYQQLTEKMFGNYPMRADQSPDGLIFHSAGESPHGFYVYDIWQSKEHFQKFGEEKLGPASQELGIPQPGPEPVFYEVEVLVKAP